MSHNKFLSFANEIIASSSNSTFIIESNATTLSIMIKETDEFIELPDPDSVKYTAIQYIKNIPTPRDVIFTYKGRRKAKIHFHRTQELRFTKFKNAELTTWI